MQLWCFLLFLQKKYFFKFTVLRVHIKVFVHVAVQEQASWVCQCEEGVVQHLEQDFKATLQQQSSLEQWAAWLENVVTQVLKPYEHRPSFPRAARQFLLKWSFYRSAKGKKHRDTPVSIQHCFEKRKHLQCLYVSPVLWWSGTWPCVVLPASVPSTWFACCMMSTCFT